MIKVVKLFLTVAFVAVVVLGQITASASVEEYEVDLPGCKGTVGECSEYWLKGSNEAIGCIWNYGPSACAHAWDAKEWAVSLTYHKFYKGSGQKSLDGDMGNAFQHCAWMGALSTRVGSDSALRIGTAHEYYFANPTPDRYMDFANNEAGVQIGQDAIASGTSDTWGYVMKECEKRAKQGTLFGLCGWQGSYRTHDPYTHVNSCGQF